MMLLAEQRILKRVEKGRRAGRCLQTFRAAENLRMPVEGQPLQTLDKPPESELETAPPSRAGPAGTDTASA